MHCLMTITNLLIISSNKLLVVVSGKDGQAKLKQNKTRLKKPP